MKKKHAALKELKTIESQSVALKSAEKKTKQVGQGQAKANGTRSYIS